MIPTHTVEGVLATTTSNILVPYWKNMDTAFEETLKIHKDGLKLLAQ
ncbi:MAG: hypothetical protein M0R51_10445 [Clostridia bacterium]|jgi:hypothetical protein|nr:hypothetical protein [Clostridia bacterium]